MVRIPNDPEPTHPGEMLLEEFLVAWHDTKRVGKRDPGALPASK